MIDWTVWHHLLQRYVNDQGQVNYQAWQTEEPDTLRHWLAALQPAELTNLGTNGHLAFWLNLYNALTIQQVLDRYPIPSIRPSLLGVPNWLAFWQFFNRTVLTWGDRALSLNDIEHKILRPEFEEPRIHFALVCASIGCPLLRPEAYWPDQVQEQLEADAIRFINNSNKVSYSPQSQTLACSKIFKWYKADFLKVAPSVAAYIQPYLKANMPLEPTPTVAYLPYDWTLNRQ